MAQIYPLREDLSEIPFSELRVYNLLQTLPDTFHIFHSVQWIKRGSRWKSTWKENDFLILNKKLGALVLEVKGGEIECRGGIFHQINIETREENILSEEIKKDPLSQAIDGIYHYRKLINTIKPELDNRFPIEAVVWFSTSRIQAKIASFPLKYREISGAVLGDESFSRGNNIIYDVLNYYDNQRKTHVSDEEFQQIVDLIASDFELITAPSARKGQLDHAFLKLTNEQTGLLDYISEQKNATIQGIAGTGKTLIAKEAARRFGLKERKVLFLCFNRFLYIDLSHRYQYRNVTYYNINSLIAHYRSGVDTSTAELRTSALQDIDWDELDFEDIIIDEAQDFDNREILYFRDLAELKGGHFFVFYDKNQLLTTREVPAWIRDSECRLLLTKNCRNTREIALTSYNIIDIAFNQKIMMVHGDQPSICFTKGNGIPILARLLRKLVGDTYGYERSDIVILSLKKESESIIANIQNIDGIPISKGRNNSSVLFTTSKKFKGLESRVVIIVDIDVKCFKNEENKRNFYVACSRATQNLFLFVNADDKEIDAMADAISSRSHFVARGIIAMKTQARIIEL